ncbi:MAG TPA: sigma-70 family RNA polymerase sigma factor [Anaerolineales bacterium]|nr:sigma-70 family RNA polymerase sigma factor [Anaerolineales bacterium]
MPSRDAAVQEELSDQVLAARVARGDSAALEALYDRHASTVLGMLVKVIGDRAMAEDVLQETFWRLWKSASSYDAQRGPFTGWLFRIARNLAIDAHRRMDVRPQAIGNTDEADVLADRTPDPDTNVPEQVQADFRNRQIRSALAALPRLQRQVIEMAYFYGMTRQEIAEATGEALGTIHTRARLGLQKLREELERVEFEG